MRRGPLTYDIDLGLSVCLEPVVVHRSRLARIASGHPPDLRRPLP